MRAILFFFLSSAAFADTPPNAPRVFESAEAMRSLAHSSWGGAKDQELAYKQRKLTVFFRSYTSGRPTSEPVVFVEKQGRWIQVLNAIMCPCEMEATIEGDVLVLWRLQWPEGKMRRTEFLRFNLENIDAP